MKECQQCRTPLPASGEYCVSCGVPLKGADALILDPEKMQFSPDDGELKSHCDEHPGGLRPILQLVLKGELVPDGEPGEIEILTGDKKGKKERMQPLKFSSERILGYLCENSAGDLVYKAIVESQEGKKAARYMIDFASDENRQFPGMTKAEHARLRVGSYGNAMSNPTWENTT